MSFGKPSYCEPLTTPPPEPGDCRFEDHPVCPYCGDEDENAWELGSGGEEDGSTECGNCNRPYFYQRHIEVTYSTTPIIGPHPEESK